MANTRIPQLAFLAIVGWLSAATLAVALPPLGLTKLGPASDQYQNVSLIDGSAYVGRTEGIVIVDDGGQITQVTLSLSTSSRFFNHTHHFVKADDGRVLVGANLENGRAAVFDLSQPTTPLRTWPAEVFSILTDGSVIANVATPGNPPNHAARLMLDGTILEFPDQDGLTDPELSFATSNGYSSGEMSIPGTIGTDLVLFGPDGQVILFEDDITWGLTDRDGGEEIVYFDRQIVVVNIAEPASFYSVDIDFNGNPGGLGLPYILSETNMLFLNRPVSGNHLVSTNPFSPPGPDGENATVRLKPLLEVFPDLPPMVDSEILDVDTGDGRFYLLFETGGQAYLYGGIDPSVVPEPATALLIAMILGASCTIRRQAAGPLC